MFEDFLYDTYFESKEKHKIMNNRITPDNITELKENEVFVFGSNLSGRHGKGAAKTALTWGAKYGQGIGMWGRTYAIPTKSHDVRRSLAIHEIKPQIDDFINWAKYHQKNVFLVTEIGCGLAGYKPKDIAPLFQATKDVENIHLPKRFWRYIK